MTEVGAAAPACQRPPRPATRLILPLGVLALGGGGFLFLPGHLLGAGGTALWMGLVGLAMYLPMAALRELPLNGAALTGLAAYRVAFVAGDGGPGHWLLGIAVAAVVVTALSALSGLASLTLTGLYFTALSLVIQIGIEKSVFSIGALTGGAAGRGVARPDLRGWLGTGRVVYLVAAVTCLVVSGAVWYVKQTRLVARWALTGHQPEAAEAVGLRRPVQKVAVFAVSGAIVGIAGCLAAFVNGAAPPVIQFGVIWSIVLVAIPLASAQAQAAFTARRRRDSAAWDIGPVMGYARPALEPPEISAVDGPSMALVGEAIGVSFGGVRALDLVDVRVGPGQRVAIVGAHGAGKTTLINALSGFVPLAQGRVSLGGVDVTGLPPHARARAGLSRTFQRPRLAGALTVRQNVEAWHGWSAGMHDRADWLMQHLWVSSVADVPVDLLPLGFRRRVELARSLVCRPGVLLLDEPVGGLEDEEVSRLIDVLLDLQELEGWGLLIVENHVDVVKSVADQLMVMHDGVVVLAETMPARV